MTTSTVSFKITNSQKNSVPFKAKFTSDSGKYFFIQLINSQFSLKKECQHLMERKVHTFMCHTLLQSMENRKKENQLLKLLTCIGLTCSRAAYPNMCHLNWKEVGQELSVRKNEIFIFFNNHLYIYLIFLIAKSYCHLSNHSFII